MTRGELRTLVRMHINEVSAGFWTDATLNDCLNRGKDKVNSEITKLREDYFTVSKTFSTTANTKSYAWPANSITIRRLEHYASGDASDIDKLTRVAFPQTEGNRGWPYKASGKPREYVVRATQYDLYPIPDAVYTMRIYVEERQADMAQDTDVPTSPPDTHPYIAAWAALLAMTKQGMLSAPLGALIDQYHADLMELFTARGGGEAPAVLGYLEGI